MNDPAIDLAFPLELFSRKFALSSSFHKETVFGIVDEAELASVLYYVEVRIRIRVFGNALESIEQASCINANEPIDTNIADIR